MIKLENEFLYVEIEPLGAEISKIIGVQETGSFIMEP